MAKRNYFDSTSAYGKSVSGGFAESNTNRAISINGMALEDIRHAIRHEIMHINDPKPSVQNKIFDEIVSKKTITDPKTGETSTEIDFPNCKYRDEFLRAGIASGHVEYAYNSAAEFLAVAAEGDMSKYSPEFKKLLIDMGMPEYVFNM